MRIFTKRTLSFLMALAMCLSLLSGLSIQASAATVNYVTGYDSEYGTIIKNWGTRGTVATFLSPNAEDFYADNNVTYEYLSGLSGASSTSSVPSSALYQKLRSIVTSNQKKTTSYDDTKKLFQFTDCQGSGTTSAKISSFYSGKLIGPSWDGSWNREHTWPNSKGDANGAGENDIMMLRPTSTSENSSRGNKAYGEGSSFYNPNSESGGKYDLRGDVARIMLYVYTRWGTQNMWGSSGVIESKEVLLKWMEEDPVDTWELGRNDSTESIIGTRNVYVDYPELAFLLFNEEIPADMETPSGEAAGSATTYVITAVSNNTSYGTVSVNGKKISAFPKTGYYIEGYTVTKGQATVTRDGDVFTVVPSSDCTVQINFAARAAGTYSFVENNVVVSTVNAYLGDTITLPAYASEVPEGYTFQGWVTAPVAENSEEPATIYKVGAKYELTASVNFYSLFSCFDPNGTGSSNGLYSKYTGEIVEGDYLLVSDGGAMNTTTTSAPRISYTDVTVTDNSVYQPAADLIWHIESTGDGYYTIYNEKDGVYAASTGADNKATTATSVSDNAKWTITINAKGNHEIVNKANHDKGKNDTLLRNSTYGFACYKSTFNTSPTELYKLGDGAMLYTTAVGTEPTVPETEPTEPEVTEPTIPETEPTVPETEPTVPETEPTEPPVSGSSATIDFTSTAQRTDFTTAKQVWSNGGLTVTNLKGTTDIADYANPARFYKGSKLTIAYPGMTKIEIDCSTKTMDAKYITAWEQTLDAAGIAYTNTDNVIAITLDAAADSLELTMANQGRAFYVTVYGGAEEQPTEPTVPETEPTVPETEPTVPETEPTVPETEPTIPETEPTEPPVSGNSATVDFTSAAQRTAYSTAAQVWSNDGLTITNNKDASTSNVGDYVNPGRFYKSSTLIIAYPGMTKIEINCNGQYSIDAKYITAWTDTLSAAGLTFTNEENVITITLAEATDSLTLAPLAAQARAYSITVYGGGEVTPTEPTEPTEPEVTEPTIEIPSDPAQIVEAAYALAAGEELPYVVTLTGTITKIKTAFSTQYNNVTVVMVIEGCEDMPITCFRLAGEGADQIAVGDIITVTGTIVKYQHTSGDTEVEFKQGCTLDSWVAGSTEPTEPVHEHTWVAYEAVEPTCDTEGNIAYERCSECGEARTAGENPIPLGLYGWVLAPLGHTWVEYAAVQPGCNSEGNIAYQRCSSCGAAQTAGENPTPLGLYGWILAATGEHTFVHTDAIPATCDTDGHLEFDYCTTCGCFFYEDPLMLTYQAGVVLATGHSWTFHEAVAPTCEAEGNIAYQQCANCGAAQTAGENPIPLGLYGWVLAPLGHNYVDGECTICQGRDPEYQEGDRGDVNGDGIVTNDDVVALMWFSLFPEEYPLEGDCDMNGDGIVTNDDVVTLMWYSLFPEEYPLPKK